MTRPIFSDSLKGMILLVGALLAVGCAGPISAERVDHATVHQELTRNVLSAHTLSDQTRNVLRQRSLTELYQEKPEYAIADLRTAIVEGAAAPTRFSPSRRCRSCTRRSAVGVPIIWHPLSTPTRFCFLERPANRPILTIHGSGSPATCIIVV